jgi:hypothetical protein
VGGGRNEECLKYFLLGSLRGRFLSEIVGVGGKLILK